GVIRRARASLFEKRQRFIEAPCGNIQRTERLSRGGASSVGAERGTKIRFGAGSVFSRFFHPPARHEKTRLGFCRDELLELSQRFVTAIGRLQEQRELVASVERVRALLH